MLKVKDFNWLKLVSWPAIANQSAVFQSCIDTLKFVYYDIGFRSLCFTSSWAIDSNPLPLDRL